MLGNGYDEGILCVTFGIGYLVFGARYRVSGGIGYWITGTWYYFTYWVPSLVVSIGPLLALPWRNHPDVEVSFPSDF